jgi:hypothetical protein
MKANLTLFFVAVFLVATIVGWEWPYIAKLMPVYVVAVPGFLLALVQLYRDATGSERPTEIADAAAQMDEIFNSGLDKKTEMRRTIVFFAWFIGGALAIWLLGIIYGLPLLVLLYALVEGREKWTLSLSMGVGAYLFIWGLFEYVFEMKWPSGLLLS